MKVINRLVAMEVDYPPAEVNVVMSGEPIQQHDNASDDSSALDEEYLQSKMDTLFSNIVGPMDGSSTVSRGLWKENKDDSMAIKGAQVGSSTPLKEFKTGEIIAQSDASTSPTIQRSDSSSSQQRSTPTYNPYSNYSPNRSQLRKRMSMSSALDRSPVPVSYQRMYAKDDDSSMDSDEALERWARQIRIELRHAEMVELVIEAERAAEAGEERFAGKPSTFGMDDTDVSLMPSKRRNEIQRRGSYSEGTRIPLLRRQYAGKIRILALRDVDEVFPPFRQFHTHMRTHFVRGRVDEKTLVYYEKKEATARETPTHRRKIMSPQRRKREENGFLKNLGLGKWVGKRDSECNGTTSDPTAHVGDLLAEHIVSMRSLVCSMQQKNVQPPPGLDLPDISAHAMRPPSTFLPSHIGTTPSCDRVDTEPVSLLNLGSKPQSPAAYNQRAFSPKALFDQDAESDAEDHFEDFAGHLEPSCSVLTPKTSHRRTSSMPDFVTPARLRDIRNFDQGLDPSREVGMPVLMVSSTMGHETPPPQPNVAFKGQVRADESATSLLLPMFKQRRVTGNTTPLFDDHLWITPPNDRDEDGAGYVSATTDRNGSTLSDEVDLPIKFTSSIMGHPSDKIKTSVETPPCTPPKDHEHLINNVENREDDDSAADSVTRFVKVSILNRIKKETSPRTQNESRAEVLQQSQRVSVGLDPKAADFALTPVAACNCLTLSPASSLDSNDSFHVAGNDEKKGQSRHSLRKSTSASHLQANTENPLWNTCVSERTGRKGEKGEEVARKSFRAAMDIIATLSPNKRLFAKKGSTIYVNAVANDDFLHNYMYCSKPKDPADQPDAAMCAEPCQDTTTICGDLHMDMCCVSALADTALMLGPRRTSTSSQLLSLSRETSYSKLEPESWFDMANERFDGVLEQLVGSANHHGSQWNISFQAPSLKKNPGSNMKPPRPDSPTSSPALRTSDTGVDYSAPQPLFEEPPETLSDTQFHLIFGMSREAFAASNHDGETSAPPETPAAIPDAVFANKSF